MNATNNIRGYNQDQHGNNQCENIDGQQLYPWKTNWHLSDIIYRGVKGKDSSKLLHEQEYKGYKIPPKQTSHHYHSGEVEKELAQLYIGSSHGLHHTYETSAL